ncbi:MAG TPA: serine hydrolase domain-containing protein [Polyangiaceae bacterium]|nr:serine hydrolase domain-containing protein [Polyangiaceae bacterium]
MSIFVRQRRGGSVGVAWHQQPRCAVAFVVALLACSGQVAPSATGPAGVRQPLTAAISPAEPDDAADKPKPMVTDSSRVTAGGVRYIAPAGWTLVVQGALIVLTAQDGDSHVAIVESNATEPDTAVAEAWALYRRTSPPPLKLAIDLRGSEGWARLRRYSYELSPNEQRGLVVTARHRTNAWVVSIQDASSATLGKRSAQFRLIEESLRPASHEQESFAGKQATLLDAARLRKLDELVELGLEVLAVPGAAMAIVQRDGVVHARGYGVRQLGQRAPVDASTLFPIASNTKALTTLLLAQLVDEGKLRWDELVAEAYPGFRLGDVATTVATRMEHLVCACTGLPRKDLEYQFEFGRITPQMEIGALAQMQPTTKFGETYQYSNQLAAAAGFIAGHVTAPGRNMRESYVEAVQARIFNPLGMKLSTFDTARALRGNHAAPHGLDIDAKMAAVDMAMNYDVVGPLLPAGGAWSSASELIQYVRLELARGVTSTGQRIVSERNLLRRRHSNVRVSEFRTYGMGLDIEDRYGITSIGHGGSLYGYRSQMRWLPEHGVGIVILTNADTGGQLMSVVYRFLLDLLFDGRSEAVEDLHAAARAERESVSKERPRLAVPAADRAVAALAARYEHPSLGAIDVRRVGAATRFDFGEWASDVASRTNDDGTSSLVTLSGGFNFVMGTADGRRTLTLREAQAEYVFVEAG